MTKQASAAAIAALQECEEYFNQRADAVLYTDSPTPIGNEEMSLLVEVRKALTALGALEV